MKKAIISGFVLFILLFLVACPNPYGYYPDEEDLLADEETGESAPPASVEAPYFLIRAEGASSYQAISNGSYDYESDHELIIRSNTENALIFYTTDGTSPNPLNSNTYQFNTNETSPIFLANDSGLNDISAIGLKALMYPSQTSNVQITIIPENDFAPVFSVAAGSSMYIESQVELSCSDPNVTFYYTFGTVEADVPDPVPGGNGTTTYSQAIYSWDYGLSSDSWIYLKAIAVNDQQQQSSISTSYYYITWSMQ